MFLQRKALYNLLLLNLKRIESGELKISDLQAWQTENYREITTEELFRQLHALGLHLQKEDFESYAKNFEAPEEMVETFAKEKVPLEQDHIFLILFELWRRFFPEKRTISIFCDELDTQMMAHDLNQPSEIQDALVYLQQLLEEHVDQGLAPKKAFQVIQMYCANDIESFLFDFILAEIDAGHQSYASELVDGFAKFVKDPLWFDYLAARIGILEDPEEGYEKLEKVIKSLNQETNLDLIEEMLYFLATTGNHSLFYQLAIKALSLLKLEEDFQEFLEACYAHYDFLELKSPALLIAQTFYDRAKIPPDQPLLQTDPDVLELRKILEQKVHLAIES